MKDVMIVLFMLALIGIKTSIVIGPKLFAQEETKKKADLITRYGLARDEITFPQNSPENLRKSISKAISLDKIEYLLAHLVDPDFIDKEVQQVYEGDFKKQVQETKNKFKNKVLKEQLELLLKDGIIITSEKNANLKDTSLKDISIYMKLQDARWFMENKKELNK